MRDDIDDSHNRYDNIAEILLKKLFQVVVSGGKALKLKTIILSLSVILSAFFGAQLCAQEGHPLKGTWRGEVNVDGDSQALVIIMDYAEDNISGLINPGRSSFRFSDATLDAPNWTVSASAMTRDDIAVQFTATLHEIGARNRYLEGTWTQAGSSYPFKVTRE